MYYVYTKAETFDKIARAALISLFIIQTSHAGQIPSFHVFSARMCDMLPCRTHEFRFKLKILLQLVGIDKCRKVNSLGTSIVVISNRRLSSFTNQLLIHFPDFPFFYSVNLHHFTMMLNLNWCCIKFTSVYTIPSRLKQWWFVVFISLYFISKNKSYAPNASIFTILVRIWSMLSIISKESTYNASFQHSWRRLHVCINYCPSHSERPPKMNKPLCSVSFILFHT